MTVAISEAEVKQILAEMPFARLYGFYLHSMADGECVLRVPFQPQFARPDGLLSGPVYMAVSDCAVWLAIMTRLGKDAGMPTVTIEMKTAFLRGSRLEDIFCNAKVLKWGQRIIYASAECVNPHGELLTHHTLTYIRPEVK